MHLQQLASRLNDDLRAAKTAVDQALSIASDIENEFEHHKCNARRREAELHELLQQQQAFSVERNHVRDDMIKLQAGLDPESTLRTQLMEEKCAEIQLMASRLEQSTADRQSMLESVRDASQIIDRMQTEMHELRNRNDELQQERDHRIKDEYTALDVATQLERVAEERDDAESRLDNVSKQLATLGVKHSALAKVCEEAELQLADLSMSNQSLQSNLDTTETERDSLKQQLSISNIEIAHLLETHAEKTEHLEQMAESVGKAEHLASQLHSLQESHLHVSHELARTIKRRDQLQSQFEAQAECRAQMHSRLDATVADLSAMRTLFDQLSTERNDLYTVVENNRAVIEQTEEECNSMRNSYLECMASIKTLQEDNDQLRRDANTHAHQLSEARQKLAELDELRGSCKALAQELVDQRNCSESLWGEKLKEMQQRFEEQKKCEERQQSALEGANRQLELVTHSLSQEKEECQSFADRLAKSIKQSQLLATDKLRLSETVEKIASQTSEQIQDLQCELEHMHKTNRTLEKSTQMQLATNERMKDELQQLLKSHVDLRAVVDKLNPQLANVQQEYKELQQRCDQLKRQLAQRSDLETQLLYHKGLSENLRQINEKSQQDAESTRAQMQQAANEEKARLVKQHQSVCRELQELRQQTRSEQSFLEKEQQITELQSDLQRVRRDESFRRKQIAGENNCLHLKNMNMQKELADLRGRMQKDRRTSRRIVHDESRITDDVCARCAKLLAKEQNLKADLYSNQRQQAGLNENVQTSAMLRENEELRALVKTYEAAGAQWRLEVAKQIATCSKPKLLKDVGHQTD